jgi:hypothetical protein
MNTMIADSSDDLPSVKVVIENGMIGRRTELRFHGFLDVHLPRQQAIPPDAFQI